MDAWAILGVPPGSSDRAIREAYLRRARELHPDAGGSVAAMQDLNAAYEQVLNAPPEPPPPPPPRAEPPPPRSYRPAQPVRSKKPKKPIYKRAWIYVAGALFLVFLVTSGATEEAKPRTRPAIFGLIGRCVNLAYNELDDVVPCAGPHDAWVVDVIERPGLCPPLSNRQVQTVDHIVCLNTEK